MKKFLAAKEVAVLATVQPDGSAIRPLYGAKADSRDVLLNGRYAVPASARPFGPATRARGFSLAAPPEQAAPNAGP